MDKQKRYNASSKRIDKESRQVDERVMECGLGEEEVRRKLAYPRSYVRVALHRG
jgi:hypothetical protein